MEEKKRLIIIDSNALLHRAFHALPPLTNKKGEPTGAVYGFLLILAAIYMPFFNNLLKTTPLQFSHWLPVLSVAIITTFLIEIVNFNR